MSFERALTQNVPVQAVGDIRLRYEAGMLLGEPRYPASRHPPRALFLSACGAAAVCLLLLLWPGGSTALAGLMGLAAALLLAASARLEQRSRIPRRFLLNFHTETLRLEAPSRTRGRPTTTLVPFDDVEALGRRPGRPGAEGLWVTYRRNGTTHAALLVDGTPPNEAPELARLERFLSAAFGLGKPPAGLIPPPA